MSDTSPSPWQNDGDAAQALRDFEQAAQRLFTQFRPAAELREEEQLALKVALRLGTVLLPPTDDGVVGRLRAALTELESETNDELRASAVRAIVQWAPAWQSASDRNRAWVVEQLVHSLTVLDPAFAAINRDGIGEKLAAFHFDSARVAGARSAERIVAEIICEDCDALGLASDPDKPPEEDVAAVRQRLASSVAKYGKPPNRRGAAVSGEAQDRGAKVGVAVDAFARAELEPVADRDAIGSGEQAPIDDQERG